MRWASVNVTRTSQAQKSVNIYGGMAQSVEHIVHIDGVVGSSPTVTTEIPRSERLRDFLFVLLIDNFA